MLDLATVSNGIVDLRTSEPTTLLHELTGWALERGVQLDGLNVSKPSLEDVYLEITGTGGNRGASE
jgi:ABC-2 type transport system ATP-binding protein